MKIGIFGDDHFDRNLPWETSDNKRYRFRINLKNKVLEPFDVTFHLGDLTHKKNFIDGKVIKDAMSLYRDKKVFYCLGNHDCSKDTKQYQSLLHLLDEVLDGFTLVEDVDTFEFDNVIYILTSYYASEEDIKKKVIDVLESKRPDQKVLVLGHWNFYNKLYKSGKRLLNFAKRLHKNKPLKWVLGHEHSPSFFPSGAYLGCLSPNEFGQKQGKIMVVDNGSYDFWDYPEGERFLELDEDELPNSFKNPERTYLKITTDDPEKTQELEEKYSNLAHCSVKYDVEGAQEVGVEGTCEEIKDERYYFEKVCEVFEYDIKELAPLHEAIKNESI